MERFDTCSCLYHERRCLRVLTRFLVRCARLEDRSRDLVLSAFHFAQRAHLGQRRKVSGLPFIVHPVGVGEHLARAGCGIALVVAGLLHDTVEDAGVTLREIEGEFGPDVAELVACVTDGDGPRDWRARKSRKIEKLREAPQSCVLLKCSDALDNLLSIELDHVQLGEEIWRRLRPKESLRWYFNSLADLFDTRLTEGGGQMLSGALRAAYRRVFD